MSQKRSQNVYEILWNWDQLIMYVLSLYTERASRRLRAEGSYLPL